MTFTYLFFQKIRLLNSQGVFPLKLLKKISGSFYRCLIFKVRRTWVSPQRGSLLYHAVGCLSRGFFKLFSLLPKSSLLFVSLSCVSRRVPRYNTKFNPSCQPLFSLFLKFFLIYFWIVSYGRCSTQPVVVILKNGTFEPSRKLRLNFML